MWQGRCAHVISEVKYDIGSGGASPGWGSNKLQFIVFPSSLGGVPVFSLPSLNSILSNVFAKPIAGASPILPAGVVVVPQ